MKRFVFLILPVALSIGACSTNEKQIRSSTEIPFTVQSTLPHDPNAFTQGLFIHRGELYESTGQDSSWIGVVDIRTGVANRKVVLDNKYFGEGITLLNNRVYQLTWKNKNGFIYSFPDFHKVGEFSYAGEGWGLTTDGTHLIMSNGTDDVVFLDSASLKPARTLKVKHEGVPVTDLNELEYVDGQLFANIWRTNLVARIDLESGEVTGFLDLSELAVQAQRVNPNADVLNGIAWHPATKTMLITGKYWPYLFVIKLK